MSFQIIPNIIFLLSMLGIVLIILRHLAEAVSAENTQAANQAGNTLDRKGLPVVAISHLGNVLRLWIKKIWNFTLEAKDLKPTALAGYKMKKIFGGRPQIKKEALAPQPKETLPVKSEEDLLNAIKQEPKNLFYYEALAKFYSENNNFEDAKNVYAYLVKHQPTNSDWHGKLAYSYYQDKKYDKAVEHYKTSLALDSSQPTRYYNLGLSLEAAGKPEEAVEVFHTAIALEPQTIKFYISLSNLHQKNGQSELARKALHEGKKIEPNNELIKAKLKQLG